MYIVKLVKRNTMMNNVNIEQNIINVNLDSSAVGSIVKGIVKNIPIIVEKIILIVELELKILKEIRLLLK